MGEVSVRLDLTYDFHIFVGFCLSQKVPYRIGTNLGVQCKFAQKNVICDIGRLLCEGSLFLCNCTEKFEARHHIKITSSLYSSNKTFHIQFVLGYFFCGNFNTYQISTLLKISLHQLVVFDNSTYRYKQESKQH